MQSEEKLKQAGSRDVMRAPETLVRSYPTPTNSTLKVPEEVPMKREVSAYNTRTKRDDTALQFTAISNRARRAKQMVELKQGRWVKVHEPGQADFVKSENIMDILIGTDCLQAEATYTVRSYKKAAYWLNEYLKWAGALQDIVQYAMNDILAAADAAAREDTKIAAAGESWTCEIEKMAAGVFKVYLNWAVKEPVIENAKSKDKAAAPKRKSRKKKEESSNEISS